jgi:hypothetical protein
MSPTSYQAAPPRTGSVADRQHALQILCSNVGDAKRALRNPYLIVFALLEIGEVGEDAVGAAASLMSIAHRGNA